MKRVEVQKISYPVLPPSSDDAWNSYKMEFQRTRKSAYHSSSRVSFRVK